MTLDARISTWTILGATLFGACFAGSDPQPVTGSRVQALIDEGLLDDLPPGQALPVIVNLRIAEAGGLEAIASVQNNVLHVALSGFSLTRRYRHVPALAGRATSAAIQALAADPNVSFVQRDHVGEGQLKEAVPAIGGDRVRERFGLTGKGVRVALLDTGIDTDHPDLRDSLVAQHCFTQGACPQFGSEGTSAEDDHGHGTNVAGIIASDGVVSGRGFAPEAELIAVKVNDANDSGQESDWVAGIDWLLDNVEIHKTKLVNMSVGTTALYRGGVAECDRLHPAMAQAIQKLFDAGITVFAATGNRGSSTSMPAPACNSHVIAVGAVYDSNAGRQPPLTVGNTYSARWGAGFASCSDNSSALDKIACFTNSTSRMDLLAPGAPIVSDSLRGRTEAYWGTSQAAPVAAGVAALMLQCNPALSPVQIKNALVSTGVPITDSRNGLTFPSLRALAAVQAVCDDEPVPSGNGGAASGDAGAASSDAGMRDAGAPGAEWGGEFGGLARSPEAGAVVPLPDTGGPDLLPPTVDASAPAHVEAGFGAGTFDPEVNAKADCDCALPYARGRGERAKILWAVLAPLALIARRLSRKRDLSNGVRQASRGNESGPGSRRNRDTSAN